MDAMTVTSNMARAAEQPALSNLSELLSRHVERQPDRTALGSSDLKSSLSYRELASLVRSVTAQLREFGLKRGDTVALFSDNSLEFVLGLLAVVSTGARVAPLNPALSLAELQTRLLQLSATAVLAAAHLSDKLKFVDTLAEGMHRWSLTVEGSGSSSVAQVVDSGRPSPAAAMGHSNTPIASQDVALLMFTGGTTGQPKLVPLTHGNLAASLHNISSGYRLSPVDATLVVMPLFHGHGLIGALLATLYSGGSAYLPSTGVFSAHLFWPDVLRLGVTWYTAVPTIHRILANRAAKEFITSCRVSLRFIRSCSAALDEELVLAVATAFQVPLVGAYGMTETAHQISSNPLPGEGLNAPSSVGLPTGVELRIVGDDGRDVAPGGVGEVWIRGATVCAGYWNNPEANSASFVAGWFRTGDLGSRDANGYLFLRGRLKEMINRAGEKISPSDVDAALLSHPKVFEAATFGERDAVYGENVEAAVILHPGMAATEGELRDYCATRLSAFEVPAHIYIVNELPRTAKGSIDRHALAALFADPNSVVPALQGRS